jgi:opacity protein-like surface antigen
VEGEVGYQKNAISRATWTGGAVSDESGYASSLSFLVNGYYDFVSSSYITPFVSAGIGCAKVTFSDIKINGATYTTGDSDVVLAYQAGGGLAFEVDKHYQLDIKYRYFWTRDPQFSSSRSEYASHNIYVGLRRPF